MKNIEKYFGKLLEELTTHDHDLDCAIHEIRTGGIECNSFGCEICEHCRIDSLKWLNEEVNEEPFPKLSAVEYELLKDLHKDGYNFVARDSNKEVVTFYKEKPYKDPEVDFYGWLVESFGWFDFDNFPKYFRFVHWEDDEPLPIDKLIQYYEVFNHE